MARVAVTAAAVLLAAWFAVSAVTTRDTDRAAALLSRSAVPIDRPTAARVADLLDGAALLNPDRTVELLRARLALKRGDRAGAERIANRVTAAEPENIEAWALAAQAAPNTRVLLRALARILRLEPRLQKPR